MCIPYRPPHLTPAPPSAPTPHTPTGAAGPPRRGPASSPAASSGFPISTNLNLCTDRSLSPYRSYHGRINPFAFPRNIAPDASFTDFRNCCRRISPLPFRSRTALRESRGLSICLTSLRPWTDASSASPHLGCCSYKLRAPLGRDHCCASETLVAGSCFRISTSLTLKMNV